MKKKVKINDNEINLKYLLEKSVKDDFISNLLFATLARLNVIWKSLL